jgi:RimJ/RimL family protein N-acetyltransferase
MSQAAIVQPMEPRLIVLESEHYLLRTLTPEDATEQACAWLADAKTAEMINAPPRAPTLDEFRDYVASHDGVSGLLVGIFSKARAVHIGFWAIYIDWERKEFQFNLLIGDRRPGEPGARYETEPVLYEHLFGEMGLKTMRCSVLSKNRAIAERFEKAGVAPDHTSYKPSASGEAFVEVRHYSVSEEQWREFRRQGHQ